MDELLDAIDLELSNQYVVLERDNETLYVKDRETNEHYAIHINRIGE